MCRANTDDYADVSVENYEETETETTIDDCDPCIKCNLQGSYYCDACTFVYGN